jgi:aspartate kinase
MDAWEVGLLTNNQFQKASLVENYHETISESFQTKIGDPDNTVPVITGFLGATKEGKITTLGRGGSDLSATAIGSALQVDEITVWKDVNGILTTDPTIYDKAQSKLKKCHIVYCLYTVVVVIIIVIIIIISCLLPSIYFSKAVDYVTFEEASELAQFGAKVLHPVAMQPCIQHNVPVRVRNSYNPSATGTLITKYKQQQQQQQHVSPSPSLVTAITYKRDISVLDIHSTEMMGSYGFLAKVFGSFERNQLSVDVLASSEVSISLTLDKNQEDKSCIGCLLSELDADPTIEVTKKENLSILTLIANVERSSEVLATVFRVFHQENIPGKVQIAGCGCICVWFFFSFFRKWSTPHDLIIVLILLLSGNDVTGCLKS